MNKILKITGIFLLIAACAIVSLGCDNGIAVSAQSPIIPEPVVKIKNGAVNIAVPKSDQEKSIYTWENIRITLTRIDANKLEVAVHHDAPLGILTFNYQAA